MKKFLIKLNSGDAIECRVSSFKLLWSTPGNKDIELCFHFVGKDFGGEYKYIWSSSSMQGLSWTYKKEEKIYCPYSRENSKEGIVADSIGRELSIKFQASLIPARALTDE